MSHHTAKTIGVLEILTRGQASSREIGRQLGWPTRGAGAKMVRLEQRGLVRRVLVRPAPSPRSDAIYEWELTERGRVHVN